MECVHSRPTFTITDDINEDGEWNSDATVACEWEEEDERERNTKIQELMQRIRSWVRLPRNETVHLKSTKTANEALALAAISAPTTPTTSALLTPTSTSTTTTPSTLSLVETPVLAATPTSTSTLPSPTLPVELQVLVSAAAAATNVSPKCGEQQVELREKAVGVGKETQVEEEVLVVEAELLPAQKIADAAVEVDVKSFAVGDQQPTEQRVIPVESGPPLVPQAAIETKTTTATPTNHHSNSTECSNTNGNNNSSFHHNTSVTKSITKSKVTNPSNLAKGVSNHHHHHHSSSGRINNNKPKVTLKMRFKVAKRICQRRLHSKNVDENYPQPHEVTEGALQVWRALPERIRQDPSLASFRMEHERMHGDLDPLPSPDRPDHYVKAPNAFTKVGINVTNELGQVRILEVRDMENNNDDHHDDHDEPHSRRRKILKWFKISVLLVVWAVFTAFLMSNNEHVDELRLISVPKSGEEKSFPVTTATLSRLGLKLKGPFRQQEFEPIAKNRSSYSATPTLHVQIQRKYYNSSGDEFYVEDASKVWKLSMVYPKQLDTTKEIWKSNNYDISPADEELLRQANYTELNLRFIANLDTEFPLQLSIDESPIYKKEGVIYAAVVLCGLYILIIWEIVNRTFAAMIASTLSIGILAALNSRPTMATIMGWIDVETLLLLFGMMILVAILSETGIFDYLAVYAYKITNGHIWPLINCLCLFTAVLSSFLDNVTTVLLMTPVTIRLCEVMALNPVPILMCMVIYSNIGGALTPVGDPPNVIIASNNFIAKNGVNFAIFTLHMLPGVILVMIQTYVQLRFKFRNINDLQFKDSPEVEELRHEIHVWKRAAQSLSAYSKDEEIVRQTLMKKVNRLKCSLKKRVSEADEPAPNYKQTLTQLQAKYPIRNKSLLIKCSFALVFVISLFFLHSVPELQRLSLGWTALLGAIFLLILADIEDMEAILARVEWSTLLFFAALFILMEALSELGLIEWIGQMTESIILGVSEGSRLMVAVLIILWVSAITSAFVDNIPLTTMMVKITISLSQNSALNLPLQPLVWALALGACLGGNGTLIGASANVVCAGVAEQHGYKFTFLEFFKVGFPVMIGSIIVSTAYLLFTHVVFSWH